MTVPARPGILYEFFLGRLSAHARIWKSGLSNMPLVPYGLGSGPRLQAVARLGIVCCVSGSFDLLER